MTQRPTGSRFVFDVRDNDPNRHLFYFRTQVTSGALLLAYARAARPVLFRPRRDRRRPVRQGRDSQGHPHLGRQRQPPPAQRRPGADGAYSKPAPAWTANAVFNLGAYEYVTYGGYNVLDDVVDDFSVSAPLGVDTTAPVIALTAPANAATVAGVVAVAATATDNAGMASVQFRLDNGTLGAAVTGPGPGYTVNWNTRAVPNGAHTLTAVARDTAGNLTTSAAVAVTVRNPPVISAVSVSAVSNSSATITWTTDKVADSQVAYGLTATYGTLSPLQAALVIPHSVLLSGLTAATTYHFQVRSRDAQGNLAGSVDATFTTGASLFGVPLLKLTGERAELSGTANGAVVTPTLAPVGLTGKLAVKGAGSVNFAPAKIGDGVYFLNCCDNVATAYYKFTGATVGQVFNVNRGQVSFYLKSRYALAQRPAGSRFVFDVRDNDPNRHLFFFRTQVTSGALLLAYATGGAPQFYFVPAGTEDALFGKDVTLKVTLTWDGSVSRL